MVDNFVKVTEVYACSWARTEWMSRDNDAQDWHCCFPVGLAFFMWYLVLRLKQMHVSNHVCFWYVLRNAADSGFIVRWDKHFVVWSSYTHWNSLLYWRIMLFITKLYHRKKYLFNKKKRIENLQWIVIGVRRRSRVRFIPSIETTTKTKDTAETETISPWSSKHSNNTRQYESSSSRPSYVLIVIVGFRALEHLYLSESFLKCCM